MLRIGVCAALIASAAVAEKWTPMGPYGGAAEVIALHPSQPSRLYLLSKNSLLYRSEDGGGWWRSLRWPGQQNGHAHALALDPSNPQIIYAALASNQSAIFGAYKSIDGGETWKPLTHLGREVFSLAIHPRDPKIIAAGVRTGVFLSRDGGDSWERISPASNHELQPVMSLGFDARSADVIYAGTPHLPWKTSDGGKTWISIHKGMHDDSDILALTVNRSQPDQVIIGACSGIYRTDNGAAHWRKLMGITGAGFRTYSVAQDPGNPDLIYSGTRDGLWRSPDGGKSWRKLNPNIVKSIAIAPDSSKVYLATEDAGVLVSENGGATFRPMQNGFSDLRFHRMSTARSSLFVQTSQGLSVAEFGPKSAPWRKYPSPPAASSLIDMIETGKGLLALSPTGLWMSTGKNWLPIPVPPGRIGGAAVAGADIYVATSLGLYRRGTAGAAAAAWKPVTIPVGAGSLRRMAGGNDAVLVLETERAVLVSSDQARHWKLLPTPAPSHEIYRIAATPDHVFLATARGLFRSGNGTWQVCDRGLQPVTVNAIAVSSAASGAAGTSSIFVAQFGKIYQSSDAGNSWNELQTGDLAGASVVGLSLPGGPGHLLALTAARGVFVRPLETGTPAASGSLQ